MKESEVTFVDVRECCRSPFAMINVGLGGDVFLRCSGWAKIKIGNILTQNFDDIWYGKTITAVREGVLDGSYSKCNLKGCICKWLDWPEELLSFHPPYPKEVELTYEDVCNVRCIMCRDKLVRDVKMSDDELEMMYEKLVPVLIHADEICVNGAGELFVSKHSKKLISKVSELNQNVRFYIITNGNLCDEKHLRDYGLLGRLSIVQVSLHSATRKVYNKIIRGGNFDVVMKNLRYLSKLRKSGDITKRLQINFVLHAVNFKDMVRAVRLAKKLGAEVGFWRCRRLHDELEMSQHFYRYTVWEKTHEEHNRFLWELKRIKMMGKRYEKAYHIEDPLLMRMFADLKITFWDRVKNLVWRML